MVGQGRGQPGSCVSPRPKRGRPRKPQSGSGLLNRKSSEDPELGQFRRRSVDCFQGDQGVVEIEPGIGIDALSRQSVDLDRGLVESTTSFHRLFASCGIDQDSSHRLGRRTEEVATIGERPFSERTKQSEIRFVNQRGRVQGVAGGLVCHVAARQFSKLVIHQREELSRRLGVSCFDGVEDAGDLVHGINDKCPRHSDASTLSNGFPPSTKPLAYKGFNRGTLIFGRRGENVPIRTIPIVEAEQNIPSQSPQRV